MRFRKVVIIYHIGIGKPYEIVGKTKKSKNQKINYLKTSRKQRR